MLITPINVNQEIPKIDDVRSVMSFSHYIIMKAQLTGNLCFDGHMPSEEEIQVAEQCQVLCNKISHALNICKISDIPELLDNYDIAYRIENKSLPDSTFTRHHKQRALKAYKTGNIEIAESSVFGMLVSEVKFCPGKADMNYTSAYLSIKGKWIKSLQKYGKFPELTSYESYRRLAFIMRENLDNELGVNAEKSKFKWYNQNKIDDLSTTGSLILTSYRRFASSLFPEVLDFNTQMNLDNQIFTELSSRQDLNPYDREAFRMALLFNSKMSRS